MGDGVQAEAAGAGEDALELRRRLALLRGIEPDADEAVAPRQRLVERALGIGLVEMAQEAEDQRRRHAELALGVLSARAHSPSITVLNGTPRPVWPCGSKKISAWRTFCDAALRR